MKNVSNKFDYNKTLKTKSADDFFNLQSFLHISAKQITKLFFYTPVTPHQVIFLSMIFGIAASFLIINSNLILTIAGAALLFYKNVLDKVDGSLARAKGLDTRRGRFYDSISDFIVNVFVFSAIAVSLYIKYNSFFAFIIAYTAMISSMFQCSFFIYYQVSYIKATGKNTVNRLLETVTEDDKLKADKWTLIMQRLFQLIYGWQDMLVYRLDMFLKNKKFKTVNIKDTVFDENWYKNRTFLTLASSLSIGTHMFLIAVFAILQMFEAYIFVNLILMNLLLICCIIFKYFSAANYTNYPKQSV